MTVIVAVVAQVITWHTYLCNALCRHRHRHSQGNGLDKVAPYKRGVREGQGHKPQLAKECVKKPQQKF